MRSALHTGWSIPAEDPSAQPTPAHELALRLTRSPRSSAPARKYDDKRAEQPIDAEDRRLTCTTDLTTTRLARLKCLYSDKAGESTSGGNFGTSIFENQGGKWFMVYHHASPVAK